MSADALTIWTIYDHPTDYPNHFVARRFEYDRATAEVMTSSNLDGLRAKMTARGLICLARHPADDAKIVEVWL